MFTTISTGSVAKCKELKYSVYIDPSKTIEFTSSAILPETSGTNWTFSNPTTINTTISQSLELYVEAYFVWRSTPVAVTDT